MKLKADIIFKLSQDTPLKDVFPENIVLEWAYTEDLEDDFVLKSKDGWRSSSKIEFLRKYGYQFREK